MQTPGLYREKYVIRIYIHGRKSPTYISAEHKPVFSIDDADWFDTRTDAYRRIKRLPKGVGLFDVERFIAYPRYVPSPGPCPELLRKVLDEIPLPYSITAYRWYEGIDIRTEPVTLWVLSRSTFYRHRKKLLEYGIDIGKQCNVKVIHFKWHQIRQKRP